MKNDKVAPAPASSYIDVTLLKMESNPLMLYGGGITTVSFYRGSMDEAADKLKDRLLSVGKMNPWIGSHLIKQEQLVAMRYNIDEFPLDEIFFVNKDLVMHENMPYNEMKRASSAAEVATGVSLLKSLKPVMKVTICAREGGGFCVLASMSHTVADGYTYYAILNMLSSDAELYPLVAERDDSLRDSIPEQVGKETYAAMMSPGVCTICSYIGMALTARGDPPVVRLIDKVKLEKLKREYTEEAGAPEFVSTNDIITAGFARAVKASQITMAMDFRGRAPGLTKKHAGGYQMGILFDRETCESPNRIRHALNGPAPYSRPPALKCCGRGNEFPIITNWSSMASKEGLIIPGANLVLHMPFSEVEPIDTCVIFAAKPGEIGVMLFLQYGTKDSVLKELPLSTESLIGA